MPELGKGEVRQDTVYNGIKSHLIECHMVTDLDQNSLVKKKQKIIQGSVPKIKILAQKVANKKVTQVGGFGNTMELFMIDPEEFSSFLCKKCAASSNVRKDVAG